MGTTGANYSALNLCFEDEEDKMYHRLNIGFLLKEVCLQAPELETVILCIAKGGFKNID